MSSLLCDPELQRVRKGARVFYLHPGVSVESVLECLHTPGQELKSSNKSRVAKVGGWVLKTCSTPQPLRALKHTFTRARYRRSWLAAHHLMQNGVAIPRPVAFVEQNVFGLIGGHTFITEYMPAHTNVEVFMRSMIERGGGSDTIGLFLERLGDAINALAACGAYHSDLSGKNIFTEDGTDFVFLDLDAVEIGTEYTDELRMKNHVQLYDSFCDMLSDTLLTPFIARLLTDQQDLRVWMPKVRKGQTERRRRQEAIWAKQGKPQTP